MLRPRYVLALLSLALAAAFMPAAPVLDEESYLDIAQQLSWARPYDWYRAWQPWGAEIPADAYLYAHPPLHLWWIKLTGGARVAGLLWAGLLGLSAGLLCEQGRDPWGSAALFISSPIVGLSLVMTLGIDLPTVALSTAAVALWFRDRRVFAGVVLGLACGWKYPALVLVPLLAVFGQRRALPTLAAFALVFGALELFLWVQYGRPHLVEVLLTADQIGRGPLLGRAAGVLFRLGTFFGGLSLWAGLGLLPALLVEQDMGPLGVALLAVLGGSGLAVLVRAGQRRDFFGCWALAVVVAVLAHNYADGRYLLPAVLPLALVCAGLPRARLLAAAGVQGVLCLAMVHAELGYARDAASLAVPADRFTGEWSFHHAMREGGATFWSPDEHLPSGTVVAVPSNASPGPVPEDWKPLSSSSSEPGVGLHLIDLERGVGWHAETLGTLPFWYANSPRENVRLVEVP